MPTRRRFGGLVVAAAGILACPASGLAMSALPADRRFAIFREGSEIGRHDVRFAPAAEGISVTTEIDLAVKIAFITAYRYEQRAVEHWLDGRLVESQVEADDNGETSWTKISADGDHLIVEGGMANRVTTVPLGMMTDTAFWNIDIVRQRALIDTHKAALTEVDAAPKGRDRVEIAGSMVEARRFLVVADSGRHGEVWFDDAGNWVKGVITTSGETLDYRLIA